MPLSYVPKPERWSPSVRISHLRAFLLLWLYLLLPLPPTHTHQPTGFMSPHSTHSGQGHSTPPRYLDGVPVDNLWVGGEHLRHMHCQMLIHQYISRCCMQRWPRRGTRCGGTPLEKRQLPGVHAALQRSDASGLLNMHKHECRLCQPQGTGLSTGDISDQTIECISPPSIHRPRPKRFLCAIV